LASQITGKPHVVKHAGSDAGRLLLHPQMGILYEHIFRTAARVVTGGVMTERLRKFGLSDQQFFLQDDFRVPQTCFCPDGEVLDFKALLRQAEEEDATGILVPAGQVSAPFVGVYGKLGEAKGTFDLLRAVKQVREEGVRFTLAVLGRGFPRSERRFRDLVAELGLADCVLQMPFIPHWHVPSFIRMCQVVCFLERDFPITFHAPTVPREVFACGKCLIASTEVLKRQLHSERLIHGYNCLAVNDVRDSNELSSALKAALRDPARADALGKRGYEYSLLTEDKRSFPANYERLFSGVLHQGSPSNECVSSAGSRADDHFRWSRQILRSLPESERTEISQTQAGCDSEERWARSLYTRLLDRIEKKEPQPGVLVEALRMELRLAGALGSHNLRETSLFRLETNRIPVLDEEIESLCPSKAASLEVDDYDYDVREMLEARSRCELPLWASQRHSRAAVMPSANPPGYRMFWLSPLLERLLDLCDGTRTVHELTSYLSSCDESGLTEERIRGFVTECFRSGLLRLVAS
jgi:glycosyltransferase involved in cell wall biosynthesis